MSTLLSMDNQFTIPVAVAYGFVGGLILMTWRVANMLRDVRDELKQLALDMKETWSRRDHERWASDLERRNRHIVLHVPGAETAYPNKGAAEVP